MVDHDVFLPENVCRHTLDWRDIGEHKVDALDCQLSYIAPNIRVEVSRLHLAGQESAAAVNGILNRLSKCDLLIDATASPLVFNLLATVADKSQKPLVWMEVYAGGIGGMVARSRPGIDPTPHTIRNAYFEALPDTAVPDLPRTAEAYSAETRGGGVVAATDADVSIVAGFAAKFVLDTLAATELSLFPYSIYLIGLAQSWLFEAPFHTIPIATAHLHDGPKADASQPEALSEALQFLADILTHSNDADSSS